MSSLSPTHPYSALQAPSPGGGDGDEGEGEYEDEEEMVSRSVSGLLSIGSVLSISPSRLGAAFGSDEDDDSAPSHRSAEGSHADAASEGDTAVSAETPMSAASTLAPRDRPAGSPDSSARSSFTMDKRAAAHAAAPVSPAAPLEGAQMEAASRSPAPETSTIKAAAVAQSLQDRSDGPEGRGRTGKGKDPMTAAPTDAAGNPKGLPHMFSLKRDFWKLRGVKLKPASR
ncbi:hypothetical protein WJX84_007526 [Apatococcus fuscideae]|uniref:Uncharacterized protein n=1 Tax=Apatococcus fuscideae TaxID=2026836 RepID=A0AAW1RN66_9CHLO